MLQASHESPSAVGPFNTEEGVRDVAPEVDVAIVIPAYNEAGGVGCIVVPMGGRSSTRRNNRAALKVCGRQTLTAGIRRNWSPTPLRGRVSPLTIATSCSCRP